MIAQQQAQAFLAMLLCGAACALAHDAVRFVGWLLGGRQAFSALMDLLLGVLLAAGMTITGLCHGMSPVRLYLVAGVGFGAALWYATGGMAARRVGAFLGMRFRKEQKSGK